MNIPSLLDEKFDESQTAHLCSMMQCCIPVFIMIGPIRFKICQKVAHHLVLISNHSPHKTRSPIAIVLILNEIFSVSLFLKNRQCML
uniref:Uncharacterized protein n=1 Tax=Parascaris univalens TaxID=6257 RepID=A0A915B4I5_PARUN